MDRTRGQNQTLGGLTALKMQVLVLLVLSVFIGVSSFGRTLPLLRNQVQGKVYTAENTPGGDMTGKGYWPPHQAGSEPPTVSDTSKPAESQSFSPPPVNSSGLSDITETSPSPPPLSPASTASPIVKTVETSEENDNEQNGETRDESDELTATMSNLTAELTKYKMRASLLEKALQTQRSKLGVTEGMVSTLETNAVDADKRLAEVRQEIALKNLAIEQLQDDKFGLENAVDDARVSVLQARSGEKTAVAEVQDGLSRIESLTQSMQDADQRATRALDDAARYRDRAVLLEDFTRKTRERCACLESQLSDTTARFEELMRTHVALRAELHQASGAEARVRRENEDLVARVALAKQEAVAAETKLTEALTKAEDLGRALAQALEKIEAAEESQRALNSVERESGDAKAAVAGGRSAIDYLIAGDLRDQRRILEQQSALLESLLATFDVHGASVEEGAVVDTTALDLHDDDARRRRTRRRHQRQRQRRGLRRLGLPRLGVVGAARRLFAPRASLMSMDSIGSLSSADILEPVLDVVRREI